MQNGTWGLTRRATQKEKFWVLEINLLNDK